MVKYLHKWKFSTEAKLSEKFECNSYFEEEQTFSDLAQVTKYVGLWNADIVCIFLYQLALFWWIMFVYLFTVLLLLLQFKDLDSLALIAPELHILEKCTPYGSSQAKCVQCVHK